MHGPRWAGHGLAGVKANDVIICCLLSCSHAHSSSGLFGLRAVLRRDLWGAPGCPMGQGAVQTLVHGWGTAGGAKSPSSNGLASRWHMQRVGVQRPHMLLLLLVWRRRRWRRLQSCMRGRVGGSSPP